MFRPRTIILTATALAVAALGAASAYVWTQDGSAGVARISEVDRGRSLFGAKGCAACHSLSADGVFSPFDAGPDLSDIASTAAERGAALDQTADAYIRGSILNPGSYIVPGYGQDLGMPVIDVTPAELDALVSYLLVDHDLPASRGV